MDGDLDGFFQRKVAEAGGVTVLHVPQDQDWGDRSFGFKDPFGYEFHFAQVPPPA